MYKYVKYGHAIDNNSFEQEWRELLSVKKAGSNYLEASSSEKFIQNFFSYFKGCVKDKAYLSHARSVINTLHSVALRDYGKEDFQNLFLDREYLHTVLNEMKQSRSFLDKRKPILNQVLKYYFSTLNLHSLSPEKYSVLNLTSIYGWLSVPKKDIVAHENHPMVNLLLDYISEKGQKWHKRARVVPMALLKWLVLKGYFQSLMEIDVSDITFEMLSEYREHLYLRVKNNNLTKESAQLYIQTINRWFRVLKNKGEIMINPTSKIRNFRVKRKKKEVIFTLEELDRFLECILADKEAFFWYMIFATQATLGLRANELIGINREDVNVKTGEVFVHRKYHKGKDMALTGLPWILIKRYLETNPGMPSDPLWVNKLGERLTYGALSDKFRYFMKLAGINDIKGATHNFRHLLLSELCFQEQDLRRLKVVADVESEKTLNYYIHSRPVEVYQEFQEKFQPIGVDI